MLIQPVLFLDDPTVFSQLPGTSPRAIGVHVEEIQGLLRVETAVVQGELVRDLVVLLDEVLTIPSPSTPTQPRWGGRRGPPPRRTGGDGTTQLLGKRWEAGELALAHQERRQSNGKPPTARQQYWLVCGVWVAWLALVKNFRVDKQGISRIAHKTCSSCMTQSMPVLCSNEASF